MKENWEDIDVIFTQAELDSEVWVQIRLKCAEPCLRDGRMFRVRWQDYWRAPELDRNGYLAWKVLLCMD